MTQKHFQAVLRFLGAVASALTGLGAICTTAGFLAERTRWSMLGLGTVNVDLNEYLFTGARFLAFLPGITLSTALSVLTASGQVFLLVVALLVLAVVSRIFLGRPIGARFRQWLKGWLEARRHPLVFGSLLGLAVLQFAGTLFLFRAARIRNLLFAGEMPPGSCATTELPLEVKIRLGCEWQLDQHMGTVFLVVLASGMLFWRVVRTGASGHGSLGERILMGVNGALIGTQLVLLPINYGVVFLSNEFPVVQVALEAPTASPGESSDTMSSQGAPVSASVELWPPDGRFYLLQRRGDEFYLYSRAAARVWLIPRAKLASVVYLGICRLFRPEEGLIAATCPADE